MEKQLSKSTIIGMITGVIIGLIIGLLYGMIAGLLITSNYGLVTVETIIVDNYCEMKYGDNYVYLDDDSGVDRDVTCYKLGFAFSEVSE